MWAKLLRLSTSPRKVLRKVLALNDSPHAIALGVAIGIFFGMTPTVGLQTIFVLVTLFLTRRLFYFNGAAAMAATYVSNPITMLPLYYFWYRLGAWFTGGTATIAQLESLVTANGFSAWLEAVRNVGAEIVGPMFLGALITAPIGAAIAYPACYVLLKWTRQTPQGPATGAPADHEVDDPTEVLEEFAELIEEDASESDAGSRDVDSVERQCVAV